MAKSVSGKVAKVKTPLRWRGTLKDSNRTVRGMVLAILLAACASFTFAQMGFVGVGLGSDEPFYAVILLLPIALSALLLGVAWGTFTGLFAGAVLYAHAQLMPLDFYELEFVTPASSIALLTVSAFLLGLMFAIALRKNPGPVKTVIYIALICSVVGVFFSVCFGINVLMALINDLAEQIGLSGLTDAEADRYVREQVASVSLRSGSLSDQAFIDALFMTLVCIAGEFLARKFIARKERVNLQGLFGAWLFAVVLIAFMATTVVSFVTITNIERARVTEAMADELSYLETQVASYNEKLKTVSDSLNDANIDIDNISDEHFNALIDAFDVSKLLNGYSHEEDGTIVLFYSSEDLGRYILASDDPQYKLNAKFEDCADQEIIDAVVGGAGTGELQRVIDDGVAHDADVSAWAERKADTHIAYLLAEEYDDMYLMIMQPDEKVFANRSTIMMWTTLSVLVLLLVVFALTSHLLRTVIVRRVDETNGVLASITNGDLDARVDIRDTREFESLSEGINNTVVALKGWISEAETRMDAELNTAKAIQESVLPRTFPPFPDIQRFDIYASMHAAREVGGDFYDFFLIGDDVGVDSGKLGFVIADVSGKGVPAALFMMNAKALVRDYMEGEVELGEAIENANRKLCDGNDAGMFVTLFAGILDYESGHVDFVNAGHNPPLIWTRSTGWRWLTEKSGLPLGLFTGLPYTAYSLDCEIGDEFLIYTDGVTEAMNVDDELYGEDRLIEVANSNYTLHPRALVDTVRRDVAKFAAGAVQSDDITILSLEVGVPPEITSTIVLPADVKALPNVNEFIHSELDRRLCPVRVQHQLDIAVEELFVNVAHYAYPEATEEEPGTVRVSYTYSADPPSITVNIADNGIPYNPLAKPDAVTPDDIMDVPIGGLGILMAKRCVDEMYYERIDGSNVVTIVKKW